MGKVVEASQGYTKFSLSITIPQKSEIYILWEN